MSWLIEKATLDKELFSALKRKFVEVGALMEEMWGLVMPKTSDTSHGLGGSPEKMTGLKELLDRFSEDLKPIDRLWALDALDKAQISQQYHMVHKPALPYRPSHGAMSGSPAAGRSLLPSPWAVSASESPLSISSGRGSPA
jgi:hypothetical protein